ncbi:MAG: molybdopterin-dependent oxidoreductase, partial [Chloroflexota bacterium]
MAESFGRGAMTNHWNDIANSDCVLAIGSNPAENHPAAFGWITVAKERGGKLISVDPRFTRTSSKADIYAPLRSGTDIAFVNGMIKYIMDDIEANPANYNLTYITEYTNAPYLINPAYQGPAELDGLFSGYAGVLNETDNAKRKYDKSTWQYQVDAQGIPLKDKSLKDPNCVFQMLKRHVARYTPEKVSSITGTPVDVFNETCRTYAATGQTGKSGTILYAMGTTQHTYGAQNI